MSTMNEEEMASWQAARALVKNCYQVTKVGGLAEDDYLRRELRSKTIQIMNCISDSAQADNRKEFRKLLGRAIRGCYEVRSLLFALEDLAYLPPNMVAQLRRLVDDLLERIQGQLKRLSRQINLGFLLIQL